MVGLGSRAAIEVDRIGRAGGATLADALAHRIRKSGNPVVLIIDGAQHAPTSEAGVNAMFALRSARDTLQHRCHGDRARRAERLEALRERGLIVRLERGRYTLEDQTMEDWFQQNVDGPLVRRGKGRVMEGGCLCGAVRYVAEGEPTGSGICHCETCRRSASAPRLPFVGMPSAGFRFTRGAPVAYASSPGVTRSFCGRCGSPLTYRRDDSPGELDVMTVSLDDPTAAPPTFHVWTSEALSWDCLAGDLPAYPRRRERQP